MKPLQRFFMLSALSLWALQAYPQAPGYEVRALHQRPVKQHTVQSARTLADLLPGYPASWISSYSSTEISLKQGKGSSSAQGRNDTLSTEQIRLLRKAKPSSRIMIDIRYIHEVFVSHEQEQNTMHLELSLVAENEATFPGGYAALMSYLKGQVPADVPKPLKPTVIRFMINKKGKVVRARGTQSSGDPQADRLFLRLIKGMPAWKPAEDAEGNPLEQEFEFSSGGTREGC